MNASFQTDSSSRCGETQNDGNAVIIVEQQNMSLLRRERQYYVYFMASISRVLYTGVTNDLHRRVAEHKRNLIQGFTAKYRCHKLVYAEYYASIREAIAREKQLKGWLRKRKVELIEAKNPEWRDISLT